MTPIAPGTKTILLLGYAEAGDAHQQMTCKRVNAMPTSHEGWLRTVDRYTEDGAEDPVNGGYWEYVYPAEGIRIEWFGGKADGVTDNAAAFHKAMKIIEIENAGPGYPYYKGGPKILFGSSTGGPSPGDQVNIQPYFCAQSLIPDRTVHICGAHGAGAHSNAGRPTVLRFPGNCYGIVLRGYSEAPVIPGADWSVIENIYMDNFGAPELTAYNANHGVAVACHFSMINCTVTGFGGCGLSIFADVQAGGGSNSNIFYVDRVWCDGNWGHGFLAQGGDANAGVFINCSASVNHMFGFYDNSFLANTYIACHTAGNKDGGYHATGVNSPVVFLGCYSESDQPSSYLGPLTAAYGGLFGGTRVEGGFFQYGTNIVGGMTVKPNTLAFNTDKVDYRIRMGSNEIYSISTLGLPHTFVYYQDQGFFLHYGGLAGNYAYGITSAEGSTFRDPPIIPNQFLLPRGVFMGSLENGVGNMREMGFSNAIPNTPNTSYLAGDIRFDYFVRAAGWMCTQAGIHTNANWVSGTAYNVGDILRTPSGGVYTCTKIPYDPDAWTQPPSTVRPTHALGLIVHYPEPNPQVDPGEAATIPGYTWEAFDNGLGNDFPDWVSGTVYPGGYGFTDPTTHISYWIQSPPIGNGLPTQPPPIFNTPWMMPASTIVPTHLSATQAYPEPNPSPSGTEPATIPGYHWRFVTNAGVPEWASFGELFIDSEIVDFDVAVEHGAATDVQTVVVPGAKLGDFAKATTCNVVGGSNGLEAVAWVSNDDEAKFFVHNRTGVTQPSRRLKWYVRVYKGKN